MIGDDAVYHGSGPAAPQAVDETGLSIGFLSDLALKMVYFGGEMVSQEIADDMALPFVNVVDKALEFLKQENLIVISGGGSMGEQTLQYKVTERGAQRARECLLRSQYVGPAPVPLASYLRFIRRQTIGNVVVGPDDIREAFKDLILPDTVLDLVGPGINSGRSIFLYGSPGSGKTTMAEAIAGLLGGGIWVPHAVDVDGHLIKVYDEQYHAAVVEPKRPDHGTVAMSASRIDRRWVRCRRPAVVVGGELTMEDLDLVYDPTVKYYEAPLQLKSNCGMMLIDDFGRQQVRPVDLLNRWMVPLEKRIDYLTLHTGKKIQISFDALIVFSTNLEPKDLVDEAFLRRIRHKVEVLAPTLEEFRSIMQRVCEAKEVAYDESAFRYLVDEWYEKGGRELRGVHPRDLAEQIIDISKYHGLPARMTPELIDEACRSYFVRM